MESRVTDDTCARSQFRSSARTVTGNGKTYIDIYERCALGESYTHGEELRIATCLSLKLKAARAIGLVDRANVPF